MRIQDFIDYISSTKATFEREVDEALAEKRQQFSYTLRKGKVVFDRAVRQKLRRERIGTWRYLADAHPMYVITAPIIYGMIVPLMLLDISISIYQHLCFRVYGIPRVKRGQYIRLDRHRLPYLNTVQKMNCVYCSYGNGLIAYAREIIAKTEQYWCPIKHARRAKGEHARVQQFFDYGDAHAYKTQLVYVRDQLKQESPNDL